MKYYNLQVLKHRLHIIKVHRVARYYPHLNFRTKAGLHTTAFWNPLAPIGEQEEEGREKSRGEKRKERKKAGKKKEREKRERGGERGEKGEGGARKKK